MNSSFQIVKTLLSIGDVPFIGVTTNTTNMNEIFNFTEISTALNLSFILSQAKMDENVASLFFNGRLSFIDGGSKFYDEMLGERYGFWVSQLNFGLKIKDKYTIAINIPAWSSQNEWFKKQTATIALIVD